jgi:hypothetical protein
MQTKAPWSLDANIIEFDPPNGALGRCLVRAGYERYLAVVRTAAAAAEAVAESPALAGMLVDSTQPGRVRKNNADVLILHGRAALSIASWRSVRHAAWVALPFTFHPLAMLAIALVLVQWALRRCQRPAIFRIGDEAGERLLVWPVRPRAAATVRQYIPHHLGAAGFLAQLRARAQRHVVLRWFESLPGVAPGEDIDLLVDDGTLEPVRGLLKSGPGVQPIDVYTVTGLPGADYRGLPYYPPHLAEQLLAAARDYRGLCSVPSAQLHFLSLAYHALYHKGLNAGLPAETGAASSSADPEHDYAKALGELGRQVGYVGPVTMQALDRYLESQAWRPSHDMLVRLAQHNPWLAQQLRQANLVTADNGLAVFLLRALAAERGGIEKAAHLLERHGFEVLHSVMLTADQSAVAAQAIRGGNWGRGPWQISGGLPIAAIVVYDSEPQPLSRRQKKRFPFVVNARVLCKEQIRDEFNRGLPNDQHCNVIHSSDNGREALDYLNALCPRDIPMILERAAALNAGYETREPILATWTRSGRRAKIEVVEHHGQLAVKKTFKPHMRRFWAREVAALRELSRTVPCAPPLLAAEEPWLLIPLYDDVLKYKRSSGKMLPLGVAKQAVAALRDVYQAGFALIDASIDNLLVDRSEGLKLFDFEFSYRYEQRPPRFEESYDIAGCPPAFDEELPIQGSNSYDQNWRPYIGLSLYSLLNDPAWLQHLKRTVYYVLHAHRFLPRLLRHYFFRNLRSMAIGHFGRQRDRTTASFAPSLPKPTMTEAEKAA